VDYDMSDYKPEAKRGPLWIIIFVGLVIVLNLIGLLGLIADGPLYAMVSPAFPPLLRAALAIWWIVSLSLVLAGLLRRRTWALTWVCVLLTLYAALGVLWVVLFGRSDYDRGGIGFQIVVSGLLLAPIWWVWLRQRRATIAMREKFSGGQNGQK
jgi:uncharacterized membrane protein